MKRSKIQPLGPIMCDLNSIELDDDEIELLLHPLIGGVILFSRNYESPEQLLELTLKIHQLRQPRLLIAVDHEGGRVQRFQSGFSLLPACALIGECEPLARAMRLANHAGWLMATELLSIEVDFSFAPVLDVGGTISDVIGDRAFHTEPDKISKLANAFMVGMKEAGMSAVGKHFPGHGSIKEDSHISIPIDNRQLHDINSHDIVPFKALIDAGISGLMPAHIIYSAIDDKPAGFSSTWLDEILRKQLKFKGTIFSDDLSMRGAETMAAPKGQKIQAEFDKVSSCYYHSNWGLEIVRSAAELGDGLVTIQWCTLTEGTTNDQILAADKKLNAFMDQGGSTGGVSRWWPGSGFLSLPAFAA